MKDFKLTEAIATKLIRRDGGDEAKTFAFYAPELEGFEIEDAFIEDSHMHIIIKKKHGKN